VEGVVLGFVVDEGLVPLEHLLAVLVRASDGRFSVEEVDLLERETLGLGNLERAKGGEERTGSDDSRRSR
jgi:hypothetical protein